MHDSLPPPPELLAAPGYLVRRLHQAYVAAWVRLIDPMLTGPQFAVLTAVHAYPGVEQGSLAEAVALDRSTMASVARRLEQRRLITRDTPVEDGRKRLLHLTEAGEVTLRETSHKVRRLEERLLAGYDAERRAALLAGLITLGQRWEGLAEPHARPDPPDQPPGVPT
ncbi:MarR family transcriptional regulator [Pseudonocardia eucalypti]|uniref:MarR family transcriptional regulator n=1 Tax=Pseudonocardia eucalypti TaxID=648755 RepID=A0ABP9PT59_9PSEU|nr:DNA-binding MarR family transcriptional regulator [Pseudonocardia eucalypti]